METKINSSWTPMHKASHVKTNAMVKENRDRSNPILNNKKRDQPWLLAMKCPNLRLEPIDWCLPERKMKYAEITALVDTRIYEHKVINNVIHYPPRPRYLRCVTASKRDWEPIKPKKALMPKVGLKQKLISVAEQRPGC